VEYRGWREKVVIVCPTHGAFRQKAGNHLIGNGCPECAAKRRAKARSSSTDGFVERARKVHGGRYDYSQVEYRTAHEKVEVICRKHGPFLQTPSNHLMGRGCPRCATVVSKGHQQIADLLSELNIEFRINDRSILSDGQQSHELDIYIPERKLAIEFNGIYWHSTQHKVSGYHQAKTIACRAKGVRLIHIFEDQWLTKRHIVESIIRLAVGKPKHRLYARKLEVREIDGKAARLFLAANHLYEHRGARFKYGLFTPKGELVSVMTFGFSRFNKHHPVELIRFANKLDTAIVGGAQRLFKRAVQDINPPSIICYADAALFEGKLYEQLGFENLGITQPNTWYFEPDEPLVRRHRMQFTGPGLLKKGYPYDESLTVRQNCDRLGLTSVEDCGSYKLVWTNPHGGC